MKELGQTIKFVIIKSMFEIFLMNINEINIAEIFMMNLNKKNIAKDHEFRMKALTRVYCCYLLYL